jgi:hypothetical protein
MRLKRQVRSEQGTPFHNAIVHHVVTQDLQTRKHLRNYFIGLGRSYVRNDPKSNFGSFLRALLLLPRPCRKS